MLDFIATFYPVSALFRLVLKFVGPFSAFTDCNRFGMMNSKVDRRL